MNDSNKSIIPDYDAVFGPKVFPPAGAIFKTWITPSRAFDEFRVSVDIWLSYMDAEHEKKALALVKAKLTRAA